MKASTDVAGEHLESQEFQAPPRGGIRLMLVATDPSKPPATQPDAPAVKGAVVLGAESRIVVEPSEEAAAGVLPARYREQRARAGQPAGAI